MWDRGMLLSTVCLWMSFGNAAAMPDSHICYILDGILFVYGIILTAMYCRLTVFNAKQKKAEAIKPTEESIYTGLSPHPQDTYETIGQKK
ncbi:high affinity immunoglobulin epsilon receptor subunit gamma [Lampris incognitus]|uniref:high affinity immunoglobulin epsilon receptor subunit gamma n=1 Tax=Lampris incognitus TaxID=2546036 RepID=UPI0024B59C1F|nr:high affinity immunoglobulin epsilon receptor subunit gamma [Lampris incognitus]